MNTMQALKAANVAQKEQMKNFNMDEMEDPTEVSLLIDLFICEPIDYIFQVFVLFYGLSS